MFGPRGDEMDPFQGVPKATHAVRITILFSHWDGVWTARSTDSSHGKVSGSAEVVLATVNDWVKSCTP